MNAHKIEAILTEDGTLTLQGLPFHAGNAVEVIILEASPSTPLRARIPPHQTAPKPQSDKNLYPLHDTQPYRYDDPTEPVALEDWEVLQ